MIHLVNKDEGKLEIGLIELISTATNTICSYNLLQEVLVSFGKFDDMSLSVQFKKVSQKCCDSCRHDLKQTHSVGQNKPIVDSHC